MLSDPDSTTWNLQIVLELCQDTCIQIYCIALIIIAKLEKQPECLSVGNWFKKSKEQCATLFV